MPCYSPLKGFKNPDNGGLQFKRTARTTKKLEVACGQCLGCRLDRTLMWAMRITHEGSMYIDHFGNSFVTLTYRSKSECTAEQLKDGYYVPDDYSLVKSHFQLFIKRLRKHFKQKIRYFHCGEYGDETLRPHYHAILFNCDFDDQLVYESDEGVTSYSSKTLDNLWQYGFTTVGELNFDTASYVAGYILKKVTGQQSMDAYLRNDEYGVAYWVLAPYVTMSLKPGIGGDFYEKYKDDFFPSDETPVPGKGIINKVPRYYQKMLEADNPAMLEEVKKLRKVFMEAHKADFTPQRLMDKYKVALSRQSRRNL